MDTKLFSSPFQAIADNISKNKVVLTQRNKDYLAFINFLNSSNKDLKKIKLPNKRQIKSLAISGGGFDVSGVVSAAEKGGSIFSKQMRTFQSIEKAGSSTKKEGETSRGGDGEVEEIQSSNSIIAQLLRFIKSPFFIGTALLTAGAWVPAIFPELVGEQERITDMDLRSKDEKIKELEAQKANLNLFDILLGKGAEIDEQLEYLKTGKARNYNFGSDSAVSGEKGVDGNSSENNLDQRLKEQEIAQRAAASKTISFADVTDKFDKIVSKFEDVSKGFGGSSPKTKKPEEKYEATNQPLGTEDPTESPLPPLPQGNNDKAPEEVLADAAAFRQAFPLARGTPQSSIEIYELQMRENTSLGSLGNDPQIDRVHAEGSAHYENRAIDIPVNNRDLANNVINFWRSRGYYVIDEFDSKGHIHVEWGKGKKREQTSSSVKPDQNVNTLQRQQSISDFIKGTQPGNRILNDPNLKSQLTGQSPATDAQVKQMREAYDGYVRSLQLHQVWNMQVNPSQTRSPLPQRAATPSSGAMAAPPLVMINNQGSSVAPSQPQMVPIPIPTGGGGGGGSSDSGLSVGEMVNSFAKLILLTNLSGS